MIIIGEFEYGYNPITEIGAHSKTHFLFLVATRMVFSIIAEFPAQWPTLLRQTLLQSEILNRRLLASTVAHWATVRHARLFIRMYASEIPHSNVVVYSSNSSGFRGIIIHILLR